jgi:hypothetical protein
MFNQPMFTPSKKIIEVDLGVITGSDFITSDEIVSAQPMTTVPKSLFFLPTNSPTINKIIMGGPVQIRFPTVSESEPLKERFELIMDELE